MAHVFEKRLNYLGNDLDLFEMTQICGEMASLFDKRLKNVENYSEFGKFLKYLGNGLNAWDMA